MMQPLLDFTDLPVKIPTMSKLIGMVVFFFLYMALLGAQESFKEKQNRYPRVRQARQNWEVQITALFDSLGIDYPPKKIMVRVFKDEQTLEVWARPESLDAYRFIKQYPFTAFSGILGPKRKRGDLQIPEGFYRIVNFNPWSEFHLSLGLNYPNRSDSILGQRNNLGGQILIHGSSVTIGCIPIGDDAIEQLYIMCVDVKSGDQYLLPVYIFPCKMDSIGMVNLDEFAGTDTVLTSFWQNLKQGYDLFEKTKKLLSYRVNNQGKYIYIE